MIKEILLSGFLIISALGFSQTDFSTIDKNSKTVPDSLTDCKAIADYLTNDLKTDMEKARAIYIWIAHNITYDLTQINSGTRYDSDQEIMDEVLNNRKGVCQHYSELFLAMSNSVGLKSYLINGYTRDVFGEIADLSHAWNGIKIDSIYFLIDVTWAAGYELKGKYIHKFRDDYFLKSPKDFIKDHMPFDPIWQFIDNPINNNDFISKDFSKLDTNGFYAFEDSIQQFEGQNELVQLENSNKRIVKNGVRNNLIQKQIDENILQITNRKYNLAIDTLNYGIDNYNLYINHKNRQFRNPKLEDSQVKELIDNANKGIYVSNEIFYGLFSSNSELNNLITEARDRMPDLISDLEKEKNFVNRYLKKWKPLRIFMFYSYGY
ncbi:transglutaminase domain-containing protein [Saccharicrinis sp. FJH2]|uniref:transglutaminase domain-containing protein n=1 Tax=Saccharicrinis sp. FJH65 TaxID=3344659 RepID=UPI0035F31575